MEKKALKEILQKLKEVIEELEVEIYSDPQSYRGSGVYIGDDDDGYMDWQAPIRVLDYDHIDLKDNASIRFKKLHQKH